MGKRKQYFRLALWAILIGFLALSAAGPALAAPQDSQNQSATAAEIIAEVNSLRASQGRASLSANSLLTSSAQAHSEYQAFLGSWTHTGANGSNETDRAVAAGYGGGKKVVCDEAVAVANTDADVSYIVYTLWGDYTHRDLVLLDSSFTDVGVGIATSGALVYYTLDACTIVGEEADLLPTVTPGGPTVTVATLSASTPWGASTADVKVSVQTVTPAEDGSIIHVVQQGQTLWDIAIAYGKTVLELVNLNGLSATEPVVYVGDHIYIQAQYTATLTPTITNTPKPPTRTPRATKTPLPTRRSNTQVASLTPEASPKPTRTPWLDLNNRRTIGILVIAISAAGLLLVVGSGWMKKKASGEDEKDTQQ